MQWSIFQGGRAMKLTELICYRLNLGNVQFVYFPPPKPIYLLFPALQHFQKNKILGMV